LSADRSPGNSVAAARELAGSAGMTGHLRPNG